MRALRVGAALLFLATACSPATKPAATPSEKPSPSPEPVICPLTNEERDPGFDIDRPALGVKVDNARQARPQAGLESADIVFEELAEGGITRFLAIFHCSDAGRLGPVRSARLVDPEILVEFSPVLFAYSGANMNVRKVVEQTNGVTSIRFGKISEPYERDRDRPAPSNLFTSTEALRMVSKINGKPVTGLVFGPAKVIESPSPSPPGSEGEAVPPPAPPLGASVEFAFAGGTPTRYVFDAGQGRYLRSIGDTPHNSEAGAQFAAANVVVLKVKISAGSIKDSAGNTSPEITVLGGGEAVVLSRGVATEGTWKRGSIKDKMRLLDSNGEDILLENGNTWIHLLPNARAFTVG